MKIVIGTYEGSVAGWEGSFDPSKPDGGLNMVYAFKAHDGVVRSVSIDHSTFNELVSGGGDEYIK